MTKARQFQIAAKAGRLRNGNEHGGFRYHAVPLGYDTPLCSEKPSISWRGEAGKAVTCPKCLKALSSYEAAEFVEGVPEDIAF